MILTVQVLSLSGCNFLGVIMSNTLGALILSNEAKNLRPSRGLLTVERGSRALIGLPQPGLAVLGLEGVLD